MKLFIDTNVFLSFYHLTGDDLEELRKLTILLEKGDLTLYLPTQVVDEFWRNRENKISAALKSLKGQKLNLQFPALCKDYDEYPKLREIQRQYENEHSALLNKITRDVVLNSLKADKIVEDLFDKAVSIPLTDELLQRARLRMDTGNPPGKEGSIGDAICWESLLKHVPNHENLYMVADDRDYFSILDENKPKEFLLKEWKDKKDSELILYRRLSPFFNEHYPDIRLASELEKELLIRKLVGSGAFTMTHKIIAKLSKFEDFSISHVNEIAEAALSNNQINWIIGDPDVYEFLTKIVNTHKEKIKEETLNALNIELAKNVPDIEDNLECPF